MVEGNGFPSSFLSRKRNCIPFPCSLSTALIFSTWVNFSSFQTLSFYCVDSVVMRALSYVHRSGIILRASFSGVFIQIHQRLLIRIKRILFFFLGMVMMMRSMPAPPPRFTADHPFVFGIYDKRTEVFLFWGRIAHPTAVDAKDELWIKVEGCRIGWCEIFAYNKWRKIYRAFCCLDVIGNIMYSMR